MLPLSVRRYIVKLTISSPLWLSRFILSIGTQPIGDENGWIHKIEQRTWKGVWIVPYLNSVEQAESAALNSDLVVLYAHGNYVVNWATEMLTPLFQRMIFEHSIVRRNSHFNIIFSFTSHFWLIFKRKIDKRTTRRKQ